MFSDDLGFNPFDKNNNVYSNGYDSKRVKFLSSFKQNNIFCYNGDPRKKISSMNHTHNIGDALTANTDNQSDVYFYVNGGRKLYAIDQFTCCFCDMDAGRDNEGKYFKPSVVMQHKKKFLEKINGFDVKPSWVVDTRNGYQCYWIFDESSRQIIGKNKTYWNGLQKKLVNYFGGDPRAIKANQIYRVPYTWWRKGWEGKAPYFTSILPGSTGQPINVAALQSALTGQSTNIVIDPTKCSDEWYKGYAKAYKQADANSLPVPADVAQQILQQLTNGCGQKNSQESVEVNLDPTPVSVTYNSPFNELTYNSSFNELTYNSPFNEQTFKNDTNAYNKIYGDANPVMPGEITHGGCLNLDGKISVTYNNSVNAQAFKNYSNTYDKVYGDANPVMPGEVTHGGCLNLSGQQTKLLKTVVDYLNQASTALYFSNNRFLSSAARDLANQISDQFCVG